LTFKYRWNEAEANQLSIWYDIGGIFGSILGGMASVCFLFLNVFSSNKCFKLDGRKVHGFLHSKVRRFYSGSL